MTSGYPLDWDGMTSYRGERSELPDCGTTRPSEWSGLPESCSTRSQLKSQSHPLSAWIEERTRDFADFENSFSAGRHSSNTPDIYSLGAAIQHPSFRAPISSRGQQESYRDFSPAQQIKMEDKELSPRARVTIDEEKLQVEFNVKEYTPEELNIKTEGDVLVVLGRQEMKDGGKTYVSKQFEQRLM
ncbi:uncharacterized protein LOC111706929 isoform X2 [Eurytemora carolleeae]|uniref:uncharacterized protein LOC111706929 isoform X2 n=1 Tax=Eurytemora carolleeae TaxID=1294199 RepID=UPI000C78D8AF|nr:uncharacterized protein LOC111706929 isoform X2 [Eurytemora carolleeae]|eukprot:XP_023335645.1 uncharacterized protein LOC111706929 isoform X2 [Eurytemora affinis]